MGCNCVVSREQSQKPFDIFADEPHDGEDLGHTKYKDHPACLTKAEARYSPKLIITRRKGSSIDIAPAFGCYEESFKQTHSRQRLQETAGPSQLPPAQSQGSSTPTTHDRANSLASVQDLNSGLWDEIFCEELEFLEEVFQDRLFRRLGSESHETERLNKVRNYVRGNESWGFASFDKKHSFVTTVLLLYKAYLPREEDQQANPWDSQKHPSYSDRKITVSAIWTWWIDYVEEMSFRYKSMLTLSDGGGGVELLISKLLESRGYPKELITQLKPKVADNFWIHYEREMNKIKNNLKETFSLKICPTTEEEDQQDFLNNYISRSFIPCMLGILTEVIFYINRHPSVVEFDSQRERTSVSRQNNLYTETFEENFFLESRSYANPLKAPWSPTSVSTLSIAAGLNNEDSFVYSSGQSLRSDDDQKAVFLHIPKRYGHRMTNTKNISNANSAPVLKAKNKGGIAISRIQYRSFQTEGKELGLVDPEMDTKARDSMSDVSLISDVENLQADGVPKVKTNQQQREAEPVTYFQKS